MKHVDQIVRRAQVTMYAKRMAEAQEVLLPPHLYQDLVCDADWRTLHMENGEVRLCGMSVHVHEGPITLLYREPGYTLRWRMGHGLDEAAVISTPLGPKTVVMAL